ncbi:TetR/AcrR family transcriptional regulator [Marinobacteraceae bacterium S3BR75-40.1]
MAYRETPKIRARKAAARQNILDTATALVAQGGFRSASVAEIAKQAGVATGTVYRHFESKGELFSEVFRRATQREVDKVGEALEGGEGAVQRLERSLRVFAERALRGPTMAWALIAEPVDPEVDAERLVYRHAYAELFDQAIRNGIEQGELPAQDPSLSAAAIVGALAESLVGPLSPSNRETNAEADAKERLIDGILTFCIQAITRR